MIGNVVGQSIAVSLQLTAHTQTPPMLGRNVDKLFIPGEAGGLAA